MSDIKFGKEFGVNTPAVHTGNDIDDGNGR
ncbi:MAG: hypothetical protein K0S71_159 [Clostridia bacterium]|jgi:ribonucleotide monophosphatase NagD (HAD superfamily)|nr:hypothetical protein [Clostridia bacterium]